MSSQQKLVNLLSTFHVLKLYYHNSAGTWCSERTIEGGWRHTLEIESVPFHDAYRVVLTQCFQDSAVTHCLFDEYVKRDVAESKVAVKLTTLPQTGHPTILIELDRTQFPSLVQTQEEERLVLDILSQERGLQYFCSKRVNAVRKRKREYTNGFQSQIEKYNKELQACAKDKKQRQEEIKQLKQTLHAIRGEHYGRTGG
jgi:hypothetical protein